jgi:hypothetical protein
MCNAEVVAGLCTKINQYHTIYSATNGKEQLIFGLKKMMLLNVLLKTM